MKKNLFKKLDYIILITAILIVVFGSLNIYSATYSDYKYYYLKSQLIWLLIGLILVFIIILIDYKKILSYSYLIYWVGIVLVLYTDFMTKSINGANSWIRIGGFSLQPGEFMKIGLILILANRIEYMEGDVNKPKNFLILSLYALLPIALIIKQPNLGMAMIFCFIAFSILYISGLNLKVIFWGAIAIIPISTLIWFTGVLKSYQKNRIIAFLDPVSYQQGISYQLTQSISGIGYGGLLGKGFFKGIQIGVIPEIHTDFIFAAVGEEWGLIGAICLLSLYGVMMCRIIKLAKSSENIAGSLICVGTVASFLFSIFQNIGMTIGIMPIAGITLPFMSYGGSSMLTNFISLGLVLNVGIRRQKIDFR
ncbi:rod shape-determining protein RodA [Clostridium estertheticum]|uniref:rod shape-determining protein RodA n=1 Tax=Clostridium estertheticum TaxID=238834 RepID=UPI001CF3B169|nr:rod shape-determining protein RodA [Clostridium estertheticum]MCB2339681.1 rod shape-determining protein RodA [Clostridium estertheticum]